MGTFFSFLYQEILWRPLFNSLVLFYNLLPGLDAGLAIIALTAVIRAALVPLMWKARKAQKDLSLLQPEIKEIQENFKGNKEGQGRAMVELYAKHKVNPLSGCLVILFQLPILIALFQVFSKGLDPENLRYLYYFVGNPGTINPVSLGLLDLSKGNIYLGVVAAAVQYWQTKISAPPSDVGPKNDFAKIMQTQTTYILPVLILVWSYTLPSALTLYWTVLNIFGIVQEVIAKKREHSVALPSS